LPELIGGRYRVLGPLGEGRSGSVFLSEDLTSGGRVALKLLGASDPAAVAMLHRELEHLRLARHPHLVDVRDFGFDRQRGRAFYTSRPVEGVALDAYAAGRDWQELLVPLGHALDALGHLHALGLLHGDFKPSNVMVSEGGEGTLLDLGASVRIGGGATPAMATPGFAAPELLTGAADARSDLYSVGAALRELAALASDVPRSIAKLIRRLTATDPRARPADVEEVLALLGVEPRARAAVLPYAFVGRNAELALGIERLLGPERQRSLAIVGPPDSGKSTLLGELVARAELSVSVVRCDASRPEPFAPLLREAGVDGLADALAVMDALAALEQRGEPVVLVLDDAEALSSDARRLLDAVAESRIGLLCASTESLGLAAHELVLAPLRDEATRAWLGSALQPELVGVLVERARGLPGVARRLALVALSQGLGPEALAALRDPADTVDGLSLEELVAVGAALAAGGALGSRAVQLLELDSEGLHHLEQLGFLRARGDGWQLARPPALAPLVARVGGGRWRALNAELAAAHPGRELVATSSEQAQLVGELLGHALASGSVPFVLASLAANDAAIERWPQAFAHLARLGDGVPELGLALARVQIASGNPAGALSRLTDLLRTRPDPSVRARLRELAGRAYAALGNPRRSVLAFSHAERRDPEVAHALASVFSKQGRNREALEHATRGLAAAKGLIRVDLLCDVAQAASYLGDAQAAHDALSEASVLLPDDAGAGRTRARLAAARGLAALRAGDSEAAGRCYAEMLELALAHRLDDLVAFAGMNYGAVCHQAGAWAAALTAYDRALRAARARGLLSAEARCLYNLGTLHFELGQTELAEEELGRALDKAERARLPFVTGSALLVLGEASVRNGNAAEARLRFERARAALVGCDAQRELGELAVEEVHLALVENDLERGEARLREADRGAEALDADDLRARVGLARGLVRARRGRHDEALLELERVLAVAERIHHPLLSAKISGALADVCDAAGATALAERHRARAREAWERLTLGLPEAVRLLRVAPKPSPRGDADLDARRLLAIYRRLTSAETPRDILRETLDAAIELTRAERGFLITVEQRKGERVLRAPVARNLDREALERPQLKFSRSIAESVIESGEPVLTVDAERDPRFADNASVHAMQLRSVLCVPIVAASGVLGSIYLDNRFRAGGFGPRETELVVTCADQAALALEKARLLEDLSARTRALEAERQRVEELMRQQADELRELSQELGRQRESAELDGIVGTSAAMRRVYALVERVAGTDITALVTGESGTGKELVARAIHQRSRRAQAPFSAINCGAVPEALLEAELFGYKKGAFTGASADRDGLFVSARGGTVFLDELGEMPPAMQVKLLRVLQEHEVKPLGSERSTAIDVRVIAATNRELRREVAAGNFREDLYYRVAVVELALPPLRERKDDLPALATALLARIAAELGRPSPRLGADALRALLGHAWPGNVRELHNVLARAAVLTTGDVITAADLGLGPSAAPRAKLDAAAIEQALRDSGMNAARAARRLGIGRATLYRWLAKTGVDRTRVDER